MPAKNGTGGALFMKNGCVRKCGTVFFMGDLERLLLKLRF